MRAWVPCARRCARAAGWSSAPRCAPRRLRLPACLLPALLMLLRGAPVLRGPLCAGAQPTDWTIKMNKKEKRLAMATALQSAAGSITVVDDVEARARVRGGRRLGAARGPGAASPRRAAGRLA